jgi:hypothetical protein
MKSKYLKFKKLNHSLKISNFKFQILGIWLLCISFTFFPQQAKADGISLGVSPAILQIEAIPPADARAPFMVENLGDEPITLKIGYKLFRASEKNNGQIEFLQQKDPFPGKNPKIFDQIEVVDEDNFSIDSLSLGPKQKKNLILRVIAPKKEPFSDYYFSLIFLTEPQEKNEAEVSEAEEDELTLIPEEYEKQSSASEDEKEKASLSSARAGIALNVLLSIGPKNDPKAYIEEFSTPWYKESGPVPFKVAIKNAGAHFIQPKGKIFIKNMFGQTIGKIDLAQDNILAGSTRELVNKDKLNSSDAIWPETFLLGLYTADLSLEISDQGPIYTRSVQFFALPLKLLLGSIIAIIIVIFAYFRIKNKLSSD